jgi:hypothetical protein
LGFKSENLLALRTPGLVLATRREDVSGQVEVMIERIDRM